MRKVHGAGASPFVRKVRVALAEKGLDYELEVVFPFNTPPEFKKISPLGKIPVYQEDDYYLPDSSAILDYLEVKYPSPSLYPKDARERGRAVFLEEFADGGIAAKGTGAIFFQRIVGPRFMGQPTDEAVVAKAINEDLPPLLDYLESVLAPGGSFLVGNQFSIADIAVTSQFVNLAHAQYTVDAGRWPKLAAYLTKMFARPTFATLIAEERAMFGG
ncbi:MAG: glutathione S-transferase family protein [Deltaproteobacteria bacterium]|nr:glutathione S-transferase family protein [Deltaproteobacteria bacterium]